MNRMVHASFWALGIVLAFGTLVIVAAASADNTQGVSRPDFATLRDKRAQLITEVDSLRDQLKVLRDVKLPSAPELETYQKRAKTEMEDLKGRLEEARKQQRATPAEMTDLQRRVQFAEDSTGRAERDLATRKDADSRIPLLQTALNAKQVDLSTVETQINDALQRDVVVQSFKTQVSLVFAALVGLVIIGFFVIAFKDQRVRQTIFSGQEGIQFVTLFSLIIAIILFGITGILGDKELAALLGGLSGYILGRSTRTTPGDGSSGAAPAPLPGGRTSPPSSSPASP